MKTVRSTPSAGSLLTVSAANLSAARRRLLEWILANEAQRRAAILARGTVTGPKSGRR